MGDPGPGTKLWRLWQAAHPIKHMIFLLAFIALWIFATGGVRVWTEFFIERWSGPWSCQREETTAERLARFSSVLKGSREIEPEIFWKNITTCEERGEVKVHDQDDERDPILVGLQKN